MTPSPRKPLTLTELADMHHFVAAETGSGEEAIEAVLRAVRLSDAGHIERKAPGPIMRAACQALGVTAQELLSRSRLARIAKCRHVCCYLLRACGMSTRDVGKHLNIAGSSAHEAAVHVEDDVELRAIASEVAEIAGREFEPARALPVLMLRRK